MPQSEARKEYMKQYRLKTKEKRLAYGVEYYKKNKETLIANRKAWIDAHPGYMDEYNAKYKEENGDEIRAKGRERCRSNRAHYNAYNTEYRKRNKAKSALRMAVIQAFNRIKKDKPANTESLLGCTWEEAKLHIESLFESGMTWGNHGEWHIDHIRPISSFGDHELHLMNHYTNLQPLWAFDNLSKNGKF